MIERLATATAFLDTAGPFLAEREAEHNILFGIAGNVRDDERRGAPPTVPCYFAVARRDERVVGAALMTPPHNLVLSLVDDPRAIDAFAADLASFEPAPPGVLASIELARRFSRVWCAPRDLIARRAVAERVYQVERVVPPVGVPGSVRVANEGDRELLVEWMAAFMVDAFGRPDEDGARSTVDRALRLGQRTFYLWEDGGRPVSTAALGGPTPNGMRIGPVYTPPAARGHGYASAVTAAASQAALDAGRRFVFLFTDLANPTSNKIYQAIGYEAVIDVDMVRFERP
jgi:predicted GNAT family acetyltransferase